MDVKDAEGMNMVQNDNTSVSAAELPSGMAGEQGAAAAVTALDILESLFSPEDTVCFRVFDDKKGGTFPGQKLECKCRDYLEDMEPQLREHNELGRGVFFVVNFGGQTDDAITRVNAQFVEMDDGTFEEQWEKINRFPLPPSTVVQTRKSLHSYWFTEKGKADVERFRDTQKGLVQWFNGDPACVNESRVMRLPGFYHCKTDARVPVRCVLFHPERVYSQEQLANVLAESDGEASQVQAEHESGSTTRPEKGLEIVESSCDFIKYCKDNAENLPEPLWHAMISNLSPFDGGAEKIHELSAPYPGYSERETSQKISNVLKSGTGPMTCETIRDRGFKCPKLAQGGCGVKSPAALCYKPLGADALVAILNRQPVTGDILKDAETAKKYVIDYLSNQDRVIADIIINNKLSEHFRLKQNVVKSLYSEYKAANKAYNANKLTKASQNNRSLPDWYETTNNGLRFLPGELASHMAETLPVFYSAGQYYRYSGGVYTHMEESEAQRLVQEKMLTRETKLRQITDAEGQWRLKVRRDVKDLNSNRYIINILNGFYNVKEDKLTQHTPDYLSTVQLPVSYDAKAGCPLFKQFLGEAMCGDTGQIQLLQEMLGYCLIPDTSAQKCFILCGEARAGKSTIINVLNEILLGQNNVSNISWQALNEKFKPAELFGKLANTFADLPTRNIEDNGLFKSLVGEDYITVERKHRDPFSFKSSARLIFSCNSIPQNYGDKSEGFYRRLIIIKFNRSVPDQDCDPNLLDKLRGEADGIFMFALEGLKRLMHNNYKFSETQTNIDALQQYREESDSALSFVRDSCELKPEAAASSTEMYEAYRSYCTESGLKPYSQKVFVQRLTAAYPNVTRAKDMLGRRRVLKGIVLVDDDEIDDIDNSR